MGAPESSRQPEPHRDLREGSVFAERYRIESALGQGGMAKIFRARDLELDEPVAVKILSREIAASPAMVEQFRQEIKLARRVVHRNVCRIHDLGRLDELLYVTMEVIEGETLADRLADGRLGDTGERLSIFRDILLGVRAAHSIGVVHLDLKPLNVMLTQDGRTVVMDFGLAGERGRSGELSDGRILGSPAYMAPERFGHEAVDVKADIYSLGILLFELFTGSPPFGGTLHEVVEAHRNRMPPRLDELVPDLPAPIARAVTGMLAKRPKQRLGSVDQVLEILAAVREEASARTVVLATGDEHLQALVETHLRATGLTVRPAADGEEVVEQVLREAPDAVVLAVDLEKIEGFRAVEILRLYAHVQDVPIFALSPGHVPAYETYARQLGITGLVERPFASRALARQIAEAVLELDRMTN